MSCAIPTLARVPTAVTYSTSSTCLQAAVMLQYSTHLGTYLPICMRGRGERYRGDGLAARGLGADGPSASDVVSRGSSRESFFARGSIDPDTETTLRYPFCADYGFYS